MSNTPPADPVAAALARYAERHTQDVHDERGNTIELRRRDLLIRTFAEPVGAAVEPWERGWAAFADALRSDQRGEAAAHLRELAAQIQALHRHWQAAWDALGEWRRTHAEPWKADSPEERTRTSTYGEGWPSPTSLGGEPRFPEGCRWQMSLPWLSCGPSLGPGLITSGSLFEDAERLDPSGLFLDLRAVFVALSHPDRAAELVRLVRSPGRVADLAPAVALCVFPVPRLMERWVGTNPVARTVRDARQLFHVLPDALRRVLFDEFERLTTPATPQPGRTEAAAADTVRPARAEVTAGEATPAPAPAGWPDPSMAARMTAAADRFPTIDAVVVYRPDRRRAHAAELARRKPGVGPAAADALSDMMPPGSPRMEDFKTRTVPCVALKVLWPLAPDHPNQRGCPIQLYDRPEWIIYVYGWPQAEAGTAWRLLEALCADAATTLLHGRGRGDSALKSWLIDLAERDPKKLVLDWFPLPDSEEPWLPTWRPARATDPWWAVRVANVLDVSAKAVRPPAPAVPPRGPDRRESEETGESDNLLAAAYDTWLWYAHLGPRWDRPDLTEREYQDERDVLNLRQSRQRPNAYAAVPIGHPGFGEWEARVDAVARECVAALRDHRSIRNPNHDKANDLMAAIERLDAAGRGIGWPPGGSPISPHAQVPPPGGTSHPVAASGDGEKPAGKADGPEDGVRVRFAGKTVDVSARTYAVIACVWGRTSVNMDDLKRAVNEEVQDATIHAWVNRANNALAPLPLPWKLQADTVNRVVRTTPR